MNPLRQRIMVNHPTVMFDAWMWTYKDTTPEDMDRMRETLLELIEVAFEDSMDKHALVSQSAEEAGLNPVDV